MHRTWKYAKFGGKEETIGGHPNLPTAARIVACQLLDQLKNALPSNVLNVANQPLVSAKMS